MRTIKSLLAIYLAISTASCTPNRVKELAEIKKCWTIKSLAGDSYHMQNATLLYLPDHDLFILSKNCNNYRMQAGRIYDEPRKFLQSLASSSHQSVIGFESEITFRYGGNAIGNVFYIDIIKLNNIQALSIEKSEGVLEKMRNTEYK